MLCLIKGEFKRAVAFLLAAAVIMCSIQFPAHAESTYSDYLAGWKVQCAWSSMSADYVWDADKEGTRQPKVVVTYRAENAGRDYPAGSVRFTVPGIGNASRTGVIKASRLAADTSDSEWGYTWDPLTDMYTFTNQFEVKQGQSVSGGFELLYDFSARDCVDGFSQERSPGFQIEGEGSIVLEPLSFRFQSAPDRYRIYMGRDRLSFSDYESADKTYIWYDIDTRFDKDWLARGLYKSSYYVSVELPDGISGYGDVKVKSGGRDVRLTEDPDGNWGFYPFRDRYGDIGTQYSTFYDTFSIGFPKESLEGSAVTINGHLDRLYQDEPEWATAAAENERVDDSLSFTVDSYSFDYQGYIYGHDKRSPYEYIYNHSEPTSYSSRLNALSLYNGKIVPFSLSGRANRDYSAARSRMLRTAGSLATPSDAARADMALPEGIEDWNDIHWKENGFLDGDGEAFHGMAYGDIHPAQAGATPSEAGQDDGEDRPIPDITILSQLSRGVKDAFRMEAYAAEDDMPDVPVTATGSEAAGYAVTKPGGNASGSSQIGEDQEYSLVLGDDKLAVFLNDGSIRNLEDEEYDIAYVTVPYDSRNYPYEVYGAPAQDTHFDEYVLAGTGRTGSSATIQMPAGVKAVFIRVNGVKGSYSCGATVGVRLHLDWESEQAKEQPARVDHENRLVNFSYLRALYSDADGYEVNDCALTMDGYSGSYGKELAERDADVYAEQLVRGYSNAWLRSPVTDLSTTARLDTFTGDTKSGYSSAFKATGSIKADNTGGLERFSLYAVIPEGVRVDFDNTEIRVAGTSTDLSGGKVDNFMDHADISMGEYCGQAMVAVDFDYSGSPLEASSLTSVSVEFPVSLAYADFISCGNKYTASSYLMVHDDGLDKVSGRAVTTDNYDIDGDGMDSEKMAYSNASQDVSDDATEWREYVSKYVKSAYSEGSFRADTVTRVYSATDTEEEKKKSDYSYRLDFGLGSSNAKNIIFFDNIEQGAQVAENGDGSDGYKEIESGWQGEFVSVDTSHAERLGLVPAVYYSTDAAQEKDLSAEGWSGQCPDDPGTVRSIAVALSTENMPDGVMKTKSMAYVTVNMRAPEGNAAVGKSAVNQYTVQYDGYGLTGGFEQTYMLPSAETYVKLLDTVGKILIQKVDADNAVRTDADGNVRYASLTGAKIQVYDSTGKALLGEGGASVNSLGRISVGTVPYGTYYWEETVAPAGYRKLEGRHAFEVDGTNGTIYVENRRIPGEVSLKKYDADREGEPGLAGAEFELYTSKGEQVFTDGAYRYLASGTVSSFVTDGEGMVRVTGLPWGAYYFVEKKAPQGYEMNPEQIPFTISRDKLSESVKAGNVQQEASVVLTKRDSEDGRGLKDAYYDLYEDAESKKIAKTSNANADGTRNGGYGNSKAENTVITIPRAEELEVTITYQTESTSYDWVCLYGSGITPSASNYSSSISKKLGGTTKKTAKFTIPGDTVQFFFRSDGSVDNYYGYYAEVRAVRGEWKKINEAMKTNAAGELIVDGLKFGNYQLIETQAPRGYELSDEPVEFTLDASTAGTMVEVSHVNDRKPASVQLMKVSDDGMPLEGAVYSLCKEGSDLPVSLGLVTGSDGRTSAMTGLDWGDYYFVETQAPKGYVLDAGKISFTVDKDTVNAPIQVTARNSRQLGSIKITKMDEETKAKYLAGAEFSLYKNDGSLVSKGITTGPDGTATVDKLDWGSYYLEETKAPEGYGVAADKIRFSVNEANCGIVQHIVCYDPVSQVQIKINKEINEQYDAFGIPAFLFKISGTDLNGTWHEWTKSLTLDGINSGSVILAGIPAGMYTVREMEVSRYVQSDILPVKNANINGNAASVDLRNEKEAEVTFKNTINQYEKFSHTSSTMNVVSAKTKPTALTVEYHGPALIESDTETKYTFTADDLTATAVYDDGTIQEIPFHDMVLDPATITGINNTSGAGYTIKVSYIDEGITVSDTFSVDVRLQVPKIHTVTYDANGGYFAGDTGKVSNQVTYEWKWDDTLKTEVAKTPNANADGTRNGGYGNNKAENTVVTIPGAEELEVTITYQTESTSYDWVCLYGSGITPSASNYSSSISNKLGGTTKRTETFTIPGDTVQIFFRSNDGNIDGYYGYYAEVSGRLVGYQNVLSDGIYIEPEHQELVFAGWFTNLDCTAGNELNLDRELSSDIHVYAKWVTPKAVFLDGKTVNGKMKFLSGNGSIYGASNNTIKVFERSAISPDISKMSERNIASTADSDTPIYIWFEASAGIIKWWSKTDTALLNNDSSYMFNYCQNLSSLDVSGFDTTSVTNMKNMFGNCQNLANLDISGFDTSSVTDMSNMFYYCYNLASLDISGFDTSSVTDMSNMFYYCYKSLTSLDVSDFNTTSVTDMSNMFYYCQNLTNLDISGFDTTSVTDMSGMFYNCNNLANLDVSGFNTTSVTDMSGMFYNCQKLASLDVSGFDTTSVTNMDNMFYNCQKLASLDVSGFDTTSVTNMDNMFGNCQNLASLDVSGFDTSSATNISRMFWECRNLTSLDVSGFDTSSVTNMSEMFYRCRNLTSLDVSGFDTSSVTNMGGMLSGCNNLASLDVSGFNTSSVKYMRSMFYMCGSLTSLDVSGFDTSSVTNMSGMFDTCANLTGLDLSGFDTSSVTNMSNMFSGCYNLTSLDVSGFDTSSVTNMRYMFYRCQNLVSLDAGNFDTTSVTDMSEMFQYCYNLAKLDLSGFDTTSATTMRSMFSGCNKLLNITYGSNFYNTNVNEFGYMYNNCPANKPNWTNGTWDANGTFIKN